jgi:hypothetical protein
MLRRAPTMPTMPGAERRTPARLPGGVGDSVGGDREKGPQFRGGDGEQSEQDDKFDDLLDEVKEANKLLKELIAAVKEKPPGQPNGPEDDNDSPMDGPGNGPGKGGGDWGRKALDAINAGEGMAELDTIVAEFAPMLAAL